MAKPKNPRSKAAKLSREKKALRVATAERELQDAIVLSGYSDYFSYNPDEIPLEVEPVQTGQTLDISYTFPEGFRWEWKTREERVARLVEKYGWKIQTLNQMS